MHLPTEEEPSVKEVTSVEEVIIVMRAETLLSLISRTNEALAKGLRTLQKIRELKDKYLQEIKESQGE